MAIIIKGDVKGDIIAEGGVKNETHYHYGDEQRVERKTQRSETHVAAAELCAANVLNATLSPSRQNIIDGLMALIDKGEWTGGASAEMIKDVVQDALGRSSAMWQLLERGRGDRLRVVWQNLIGYFADRRLLPVNIGSPALNKMFFGDDNGYSNIDKGRPSRGLMTADFEDVARLLDAHFDGMKQ